MALQYRNVDEEIDLIQNVADLELHSRRVHLVPAILLIVIKGNLIGFAKGPVSTIFVGIRGFIPNPRNTRDMIAAVCGSDVTVKFEHRYN